MAGACSFRCLRSPKNELWGELGFPIRKSELWASPFYVESYTIGFILKIIFLMGRSAHLFFAATPVREQS